VEDLGGDGAGMILNVVASLVIFYYGIPLVGCLFLLIIDQWFKNPIRTAVMSIILGMLLCASIK
jgi:undecaprenyl pyrophosphate phosphatase UppP